MPPRPWRNTIHPRNLTSLLQYLFPRTHKRLSNRFIDFRIDTLPRIKHQAQLWIYQAILGHQRRHRERKLAGTNWSRFIPRVRSRRVRRPTDPSISAEDAGRLSAHTDTQTFMATGNGNNAGWSGQGESRAPGQRRQKVFGYLKAANDLRQSYQQSISNKWQEGQYDEGIPGGFPDTDIVRNGDEEMLLFPSYARRHIKVKKQPQQGGVREVPGSREDISNPDGGDADYWRREWEKYEDENAIVDVDVRGWIYSPQRGPLNRRNRLLVAVARRLSGIPALDDSNSSGSRESSQGPGDRKPIQDDMLSQEEEAAAREAELIQRRGQREAEAASKGTYSTNADNNSLFSLSPGHSRSSSPVRPSASSTIPLTDSEPLDSQRLAQINKRQSWNSTSRMSREEVVAANDQLMTRLRPFMTLPLANTPITIFFYNEKKSQSKSIYTDDSGHFKVRAALDFVPNKVRVLASEKLSATEDVLVTDSEGISIVSDIDDTIKHSAIALGAKEIFKNTFLRDLGELTIPGVKEWYSKMASMGVKMHYVSNSPWQLYPLLRSYFAMAGLPPGSFHLKQYSGMLQGIFEPAAERKKGSLDRIMHDFPERKFILIGDSGEADLEVYTDIVQEHPGRVLAVFIRDVTSRGENNNMKDFFYASHPEDHRRHSDPNSARSTGEQSKNEGTPDLPQRPKPQHAATEDLIDFSENSSTPSPPRPKRSYTADMAELESQNQQPNGRSPAPAKPAKPSNLRSISTVSARPLGSNSNSNSSESGNKPPQPQRPIGVLEAKRSSRPAPPGPRRTNTGTSTASANSSNSTGSSSGRFYANKAAPPPPPKPEREGRPTLWQSSSHWGDPSRPPPENPNATGYLASARHQLSNAYNALPPLRSQHSGSSINSDSNLAPRRGLSSYPAAAARYVTGASGGDPAAGGDGGAAGAPYDKKLEMWKRRWARSEEIMRRQGVVLRAWRMGTDVAGLCERIVRQELDKEGTSARK